MGKNPFSIIFNDEYLVVLNKIAKIVVQPTSKREKHTLTSVLKAAIKQKVFPCHRLDRETTGLIIYAKTSKVQKEVMEQFRNREVKKKYTAFVKGKLKRKKGLIDDYIIDKEGARFGERAKRAKTFFSVLREYEQFSVLELKPLTGRTNQLRIQLAKMGNPILGERRYAFRRDFEINFRRLALHACFISFIHPISKDSIRLEIKLADDMSEFLKQAKQ